MKLTSGARRQERRTRALERLEHYIKTHIKTSPTASMALDRSLAEIEIDILKKKLGRLFE